MSTVQVDTQKAVSQALLNRNVQVPKSLLPSCAACELL